MDKETIKKGLAAIGMNEDIVEGLQNLRYATLSSAQGINQIMDILKKYYPYGTKVIITKDYWEVKVTDEN